MKKEVENAVNEVIEEIGIEEGLDVTVLEPAVEGSGAFGKKLSIGLAVVGCVTGAVYYFKNRDKINEKKIEKQIAKLEAKGYVVTKPFEESVEDDDDGEDENVQEEKVH